MTLRFCRVRVEVDYFGTLILSLMLAVDRMGVMLPALAACALHELGHIAAILLTGGRVRSVRLCPWGIQIVRIAPMNSRGAALAVALAGPAVNILLWAVLRNRSPAFAAVQLVCGAFNLLPCEGLDGGDALRGVLLCCLSERRTERVMFAVSCAVGVLCVLSGAALLWAGCNPSLLVAGLYLAAILFLQEIRSRHACS